MFGDAQMKNKISSIKEEPKKAVVDEGIFGLFE